MTKTTTIKTDYLLSNVHTLPDRTMLVDVSVSLFGTSTADDVASQTVHDAYSMQAHSGRYIKKLFPHNPPELKRIRSIGTRIGMVHRSMTSPWLDGGQRIMLRQAFDEFGAQTRGLVREFNEAADAFVADYDSHVANAKAWLGGRFNECDYPSAQYVRSRYGVSIVFLPVPSPNDFRVQLDSGAVADLRQRYEQFMELKAREAQEDVYKRVTDAVQMFADRVFRMHTKRQEAETAGQEKRLPTIRDSTVEIVRELVRVIPQLNLLEDPRLDDIVDDIKNNLAVLAPDDLREDGEVRLEAIKQAEDIMAKMASFM